MDQERFCGFLKCLYSLRLPSCHLGVDGCDVLADFADLETTLAILFQLSLLGRSHTSRENGNFAIRSSVDFWYRLISRNATVPGRYRGFRRPGENGVPSPGFRGAFAPMRPGVLFPPMLDLPCILGRPLCGFWVVCVRAMASLLRRP